MTKITYRKTDDHVEIEATGHAGNRTACEKISILLQTLSDELYEMLGDNNSSLAIINDPGISHIRFNGNEHDISLIFEMTMRGLYIVKDQFDEHLDITEE